MSGRPCLLFTLVWEGKSKPPRPTSYITISFFFTTAKQIINCYYFINYHIITVYLLCSQSSSVQDVFCRLVFFFKTPFRRIRVFLLRSRWCVKWKLLLRRRRRTFTTTAMCWNSRPRYCWRLATYCCPRKSSRPHRRWSMG